jgi:5-methylthioadenosine/S-adenosylhomocysteine deaminase
MTQVLIRGCDLLLLSEEGAQIATGQDIAIEGNRIAGVEPTGQRIVPEGTKLVPAEHLLAVPGLINTHAHTAMVLFRGLVEDVTIDAWFNEFIWPLESNLTPEDVYWGTMLGLAEMIEAGVTQVADHYFFMDQVAQAVADAGMRGDLAWAAFGHEGQAKLEETCAFVERWSGGAEGRIRTWLGPHAPYTTGPEFLEHAAKRADELGVGIHTHLSETQDQVRRSLEEHGITPVQMLAETGVLDRPAILAHCLFPEEGDFDLLASAHAGIAHAPKTYMKLGMGTAPLRRFREASVPVGLATDGAVSSNTLDILEQLRLMALTQKDAARDSTIMPVAQALQIAFQGSAAVVNMGEDLGDLAPGKLADITLLRQEGLHLNPRYDPAANLVYAAGRADVHTVICDGKILLEEGQLTQIDKAEIKREVAKRLDRLSQRVPEQRIATYPS